jgi:hypothetical protein
MPLMPFMPVQILRFTDNERRKRGIHVPQNYQERKTAWRVTPSGREMG